MPEETELKRYMDSLPTNMNLKKKVIKSIMTSKQPLTQKEILDAVETKDWTNVKRILRDLLDHGLVVKKIIGTREYYVKMEVHGQGKQFEVGNTIYYFDIFEPDYEGEEKYLRIKQAVKIDRDNYEVLGKITIKKSQLDSFIKTIKEI